jgi:DNA-binding CsgD family transcriptional regulator
MTPQRRSRIRLRAAERAELERRVASSYPSQVTYRAKIILGAAAGQTDARIADELGLAERTVWMWRRRFLQHGLEGLDSHRKSPAPHRYDAAVLLSRLLALASRTPGELDPARAGQTRWTIEDFAQYLAAHPELGLGAPSRSTIGVVLKRNGFRLDRLDVAKSAS